MGIAANLIIIILIAFVSGFIMLKLGQPIILGYIIAGIIIGPYAKIIGTAEAHDIELLAEIGVALLLFALGLEFSFKNIKEVSKIALIGTPIQIISTIFFGIGIGKLIGWDMKLCIWFGCLISLSSTMVILKSLMGQGLIGTLSSRVMIGMLIVQDLAVIPMLIILPKLNQSSFDSKILIIAALKALIFIVLMIIIGTKLLPKMLSYIASLASRELFLIAITAIGLGIGYFTYKLGLSFAFGAFVAGMILSESDYGHQALSDIVPLRDLFGMLFFTSVGMLLDPEFLIQNIKIISFLVIAICIFKGIVFASLAKVFKYKNIVPIALGLGLFQVGEFSFVIARVGVSEKIISHDFYNLILSIAVVTMVITPIISSQTARIYRLKKRYFNYTPIESLNFTKKKFTNHIVIAGGGRVGFQLSEILKKINITFIIIEIDQKRVLNAKEKNYPVIYGDTSHELVLNAAHISEANILVITSPDIVTAESIIKKATKINKNIKIISLGTTIESYHNFLKFGVENVIIPDYEAGVEISRQVLTELNVSMWETHKLIDSLRNTIFKHRDKNKKIYKTLNQLSSAEKSFKLEWGLVDKKNRLLNLTIKDLKIRERTGVSIVGIIRDENIISNPDILFKFLENDKIAILGSDAQIDNFKNWAYKSTI